MIVQAALLMICGLPYEKLIRLKTEAEHKKALAAGTPANTVGGGGRTWLMFAAETNKLALAELLIDKGADVNATGEGGITPLWLAVDFAGGDMVKLLLQKGANASPHKPLDGQTPLHRMMGFEGKAKTDVIRALVEGGAELEAKNIRGERPLHSGAEAGDVARLTYLLEKGADANAADKEGNTPLHAAALGRHRDAVKLLVQKGAKVDARTKAGESPLLRILHSQEHEKDEIYDVARTLVELGADKDAQNDEGETALHLAVISGSEAWLKTLLSLGVDVTKKQKKGKTAFTQAVINKNAAAVRLLAPKCKAELNGLDGYGATFVHNAVINDEIEMVKLFIAVGADLSVKNKWGKTALGAAKQMNKAAIIPILEAAGASE